MRRLIDADKLMQDIRNTITEQSGALDYLNLINRQPTTYTVDKVVEQLEAYSNADEAERLGTMPVVELADAIKIVKGGGVDAKTDS